VLVVAGSAAADDLRRALGPDDIEVHAAPRKGVGPTAREPDVVVVGLEVPTGLDDRLMGLPVLTLVRRDSPEDLTKALAAGAFDVLAVPLIAEEAKARVAAAARLSAAESSLAARNAELEAWADRTGHDLMTPLAVISGMAETLEAAWERLATSDRASLLASIRNQAARATKMLDEAIAIARPGPDLRPDNGPPPR